MTSYDIFSISSSQTETFNPDEYDNPIRPERFRGLHETRLSKQTGVKQFGVNQVTLEPGCYSALRHWHTGEDEFVLITEGTLILIDDGGERPMSTGDYVGFPAGVPNGHHFANFSSEPATYLVVGSRKPGADACHYPDDDLGPVDR